MANLRDIKKRISSVTTTKQITRTMEMVSTAKIRRALDRSKQAEPYKEALTDVMLTVAGDASCSGTDPMLQKHESVKHGLIVVIASDRGLAGGFNTTVERTAEKLAASWANDGIECEIIACGRKPATYFRDRANVVMHFEGNSSEPDFNQARMISSHICDAYRAGELDRVELVYHHAKNRVDQELRVEHLLPLDPEMIGEVLDVMKALAADGMTMIVVTHEMGFAREVAARTIFLADGKIEEDKPSHELFDNPESPRLVTFLQKVL